MTDRSLVLLGQAEKALAECNTIEDAVDLVDMAQAARVLANKAKLGLAAENHAAVIKLRAQRRAGELLAEMSANGQRDAGSGGDRRSRSTDGTVKLDELGVSKNQSSRWQKLAKNFTDDDLQERAARAVDEAVALTEADLYRELRRQEHDAAETPPAPIPIESLTTILDLVDRRVGAVSIADLADSSPHPLAAYHDALDRIVAIKRALTLIAGTLSPDLIEHAKERAREILDGPDHIVVRARELNQELEAGVSARRGLDIQAELDAMFIELNDIQPGDTVDHDDHGHTIIREPVDDPNPDVVLCAYPGCLLDDEHDGDHKFANDVEANGAPASTGEHHPPAPTSPAAELPAQGAPASTHPHLPDYIKLPKDRGDLEAKCCLRAEMCMHRWPDDPAVVDTQQELYRGIDETRAAALLAELNDRLELRTEYRFNALNGPEKRCRQLIEKLDATHPLVQEIQQILYRGRVPVTDATRYRRQLEELAG